jgi:shikimate kinase
VTERPKRIVLVGMMGSGKSTVGRALADELGWPLLDNDALVRETVGRGGAEIFRTGGEAALHEA